MRKVQVCNTFFISLHRYVKAGMHTGLFGRHLLGCRQVSYRFGPACSLCCSAGLGIWANRRLENSSGLLWSGCNREHFQKPSFAGAARTCLHQYYFTYPSRAVPMLQYQTIEPGTLQLLKLYMQKYPDGSLFIAMKSLT